MAKRKLRILIVEDDPVSQRLIQGILSPFGYCDISPNGEEAVKSFFQMSLENNKSYDLICMDIMMPELDGQQAMRQIREIEKSKGLEDTEGVHIIMVTALDDPKNVIKAFKDHGAIGYVTKPVTKEKLLGEIRSLGLI